MDKKINYYAITMFIVISIYLLAGVIYSPPFTTLRHLIGIKDLETTRMTSNGYLLTPENYDAFHLRTVHYYHGVFIGFITVSVILYYIITKKKPDTLLDLALIGGITTMASALIYGYASHAPIFHGLFIFGLSIMFMTGLLLLVYNSSHSIKTNSLLVLSVLMLLVGAVLGAILGSYYMEPGLSSEYISAIIASRVDPDLAEDNLLWRMRAGHEHGMLLSVLGLTSALLVEGLNLSYNKTARNLVHLSSLSLVIAAASSYLLPLFGGVVHKVITPASLLLITALGFLGLYATWRRRRFYDVVFLSGILLVWLFVAVPGAVIAMSLRRPTIFIEPAFRDPSWDYVELAYNVGHWHLLLLFWGVAILVLTSCIWAKNKSGRIVVMLSVVGLSLSGLGFNLYVFLNGPYPTNPYDNIWIKILVEPGLAMVIVATVLLGLNMIRYRYLDEGGLIET